MARTILWMATTAATLSLVAMPVAPAQEAAPANTPSSAGNPPSAANTSPSADDELSIEQARLADRFEQLEAVIGRLAELSAGTDPNRARLLREMIARSREQDINDRFESIVKLLEDERLSAAANNQTELRTQLEELLTLLLKADRDKELESERARIRKYLKEVTRLIRMQKGVRARTEGGDEPRALADDQERVAEETGKLGGTIKENEGQKPEDADGKSGEQGDEAQGDSPDSQKSKQPGEGDAKPGDKKSDSDAEDANSDGKNESGKEGEPSDSSKSGKPSEPSPGQPSESQPSEGQPSQPGQSAPTPGQPGSPSPGSPGESDPQQKPPQAPTDRAADQLRRAQQQMEAARRELEKAQREGATERQREALAALEQAKAELERVLRQLREEEMERVLTQLAARFRQMLEMQNAVYEGTKRLGARPAAERNHDDEIEAARLSRQESQIVHEADKAMILLREEGSSVAFPEAVEQMRDDMRQVATWLAAVEVGEITITVEEDIIAALEELIAALEKAIKELEKERTPPGQSAPAGQQSEPPLVHKLAELKMILALQLRINRRTERFGRMIEGDNPPTADIIQALDDLSERQQRVHRATYDLSQGRND